MLTPKFQQRNLVEQMYEGKVEIFLAKPTAREGKLVRRGSRQSVTKAENLLELREKRKLLAPEMRLWRWDRNADLTLKVFNTKLHIEQEETHHLINE